MKVLLSLAVVAAVALAEPPSNNQQQQQYYFARQQDASSGPYPDSSASGPYQARGWKPDGPAFNLPERQRQYPAPQQPQQPPQQQYGAPSQPQQQYGPPSQPQQQYGPPSQPQQQYGPPAQQPQNQYGAPEGQYPSPRRQQVPSRFRTSQFARQPQQQQGYDGPAPQQGYGQPAAPQQGYGAPSARQQQQGYPQPQAPYGAPQQSRQQDYPSTTEYPSVTEIDEPVTEAEPETEQVRSAHELEDEEGDIDEPRSQKQQQQQQQERGEYFVALPDGRLTRVRYASRRDLEEMAYFAKIRAENVEPLRGPIYAYAPLQELEVAPGNLRVQQTVAQQPLLPSETRLTLRAEARPQKLVAPALVPKIEIKPLAQVQYQLDNPPKVVPLSSSYTTVTNTYGAAPARVAVAAAPVDDRFILTIDP